MFSKWMEDLVVVGDHGTEAKYEGLTFTDQLDIKRFEAIHAKAYYAGTSEEPTSVAEALTAEELDFYGMFEHPQASEQTVIEWCTVFPDAHDSPPDWIVSGLHDMGYALDKGDILTDCRCCGDELALEVELCDIEHWVDEEHYCGKGTWCDPWTISYTEL